MRKPIYRVEVGFVFDEGHIEWMKKEFSSFFFSRRKALRYYLKAIRRAIKSNASINACLYRDNLQIGRTEIDARKHGRRAQIQGANNF